jgi:2-hydroxychromene-2-carboxylate isomerase
LYEESELAQAEGVLAAGGRGAYAAQLALKNEDAVLAAVLAAAGLQVTALRILKMTEHDWDEDL